MATYEYYAKALEPYLRKKDVKEICINEPGVVLLESGEGKGWEPVKVPALTLAHLDRWARLLATRTGQIYDAEHPQLSASIPGHGHRCEVVGHGMVLSGISITIRRMVARAVDLNCYKWFWWNNENPSAHVPFSDSDLEEVKRAMSEGGNIVVGGGTGQGKTTLLNSLIPYIPKDRRVITVEDVSELRLPDHKNQVNIVFSRMGTGMGNVNQECIIKSLVRMRPDRLIYGEVSPDTAKAILNNTNSGEAGCLTTVHANTPPKCFLKFQTYIGGMDEAAPIPKLSYIESCWDYAITVKNLEDVQEWHIFVHKVNQ